jgi:FtsH-binding integral membrane protein
MSYIAYTYLHLAGGLALTAISSEYPVSKSNIVMFLEFIVSFGLIFVLGYNKPGPVKYFLAALLCVLIGQILWPVVESAENKNVLREVLASVFGIFLAMTAVAFYDRGNLLGFGPYLFAGLIGLILARIVLLVLNISKPESMDFTKTYTFLNWFGTVLFSVYIAYDTQVIKYRARKPYDYVGMSLGLFLDIINLFTNIEDLYD